MKNAHAIRHQLEADLVPHLPNALSPRVRVEPERIPSGIAALDELLRGGFASGAITELVGAESSGRTTVGLSLLADTARSEQVCAWIDVTDSFDPESAAANGVDLERLLWVRCGPGQRLVTASAKEVARSPAVPASLSAFGPRHIGGGSAHPRSEGKDMPQAVSALLRAHGGVYDRQPRREKRSIGTPGAPNRPLTHRSHQREEQPNSDRLPPRRGENLTLVPGISPPRCSEPQPRQTSLRPDRSLFKQQQSGLSHWNAAPINTPWQALDQALRTADLLLHGGGFSVIVLDLGSVSPELAWRIPLATWFRFRAACERTRTSLLLLTQHHCARSTAELVVNLQPGSMEAESKVMTGIRYQAVAERSRFPQSAPRIVPIRKPPHSERPGQWKSEVAWAHTR